jgi:hypothetical protein
MKKYIVVFAFLWLTFVTPAYAMTAEQESILRNTINSLLKQVMVLMEQLAQVRAQELEIIAVKPTVAPQIIPVITEVPKPQYSSYQFTYTYDPVSKTISYPQTYRSLTLKKAVFRIKSEDVKSDMNQVLHKENVDTRNTYPIEKLSNNTFAFIGNLDLKPKDSLRFSFNRDGMQSIAVFPQMEEWEMWDNTTNLPVKIECGYLYGCNMEAK